MQCRDKPTMTGKECHPYKKEFPYDRHAVNYSKVLLTYSKAERDGRAVDEWNGSLSRREMLYLIYLYPNSCCVSFRDTGT
jgi:hypothetical protein